MKTIPCPHCKKPVPWIKESTYRPFCSERCRIIDLGAWASGAYSVPSEDEVTEEEIEDLILNKSTKETNESNKENDKDNDNDNDSNR